MAAAKVTTSGWVAHFEHLQFLIERSRLLQENVGRLQAALDRPTMWRRPAFVIDRYRRDLEFVESRLEGLRTSFDDVLKDTGTDEITAEALFGGFAASLEVQIQALEVRVDLLAQVLAQRSFGRDVAFGDTDSLLFRHQSDYVQFYRAADAAIFGFFEDIFGVEWVRDRLLQRVPSPHWYPVALFRGAIGYEIDPYNLVVSIPEADLQRPRLWASLAHEIAHLKVFAIFGDDEQYTGPLVFRESNDATSAPRETLVDATTWTLERRNAIRRLFPSSSVSDSWASAQRAGVNYARLLLELSRIYEALAAPSTEQEKAVLRHHAGLHAEEIVVDAISIAVAGPAALWSFLTQGGWHRGLGYRGSRTSAIDAIFYQSHPLSFLRIQLMRIGLASRDAYLHNDRLDDAANQYCVQGTNGLDPDTETMTQRLCASSGEIAPIISDLASLLMASKPFDRSSARVCLKLYTIPDQAEPDDWAPRHTFNFGWMKRAAVHRRVEVVAKKFPAGKLRVMDCAGSPAIGLVANVTRRLSEWGDFRMRNLMDPSDDNRVLSEIHNE